MPPESQLSDGAIILGGIVGGAFLKVFPWMRKRWGKKQVTKAKRGYAGIGQLLEELTEARRAVGASRALFIVSRNSGGLPLPGVPVKVSVHYESAADGVRLIHSEWQDWPADSATIETSFQPDSSETVADHVAKPSTVVVPSSSSAPPTGLGNPRTTARPSEA